MDLEQSEVGLCPVDSVPALRITRNLVLRTIASRLGQPAVVHAVKVIVVEHGYVTTECALPGQVKPQRHSHRGWLVQLERNALHALDEEIVYEQLQTIAQLNRRLRPQPRANRQKQNCEPKPCVHAPRDICWSRSA